MPQMISIWIYWIAKKENVKDSTNTICTEQMWPSLRELWNAGTNKYIWDFYPNTEYLCWICEML